jgi:hypothetical protein
MRSHLEPLFLAHQVDVHLSGHQHTYLRTCCLREGKCIMSGKDCIRYVVAGVSGAGCGPPCPGRQPVAPGEEDWTETYLDVFGYTRYSVTRTELKMELIDVTSNSVADTMVIKK